MVACFTVFIFYLSLLCKDWICHSFGFWPGCTSICRCCRINFIHSAWYKQNCFPQKPFESVNEWTPESNQRRNENLSKMSLSSWDVKSSLEYSDTFIIEEQTLCLRFWNEISNVINIIIIIIVYKYTIQSKRNNKLLVFHFRYLLMLSEHWTVIKLKNWFWICKGQSV